MFKVNKDWHAKNRMPKNATLNQKIQWHADHARECGCRPIPPLIQKKMNERKPKLVVGVLVKKEERFLLSKEKLEDGKEHWIVPGGKVEFGESIEKAAVREIKEETGIKINELTFLTYREAIFPHYNYHTVIFFFSAITKDGKIGKDVEGKVIESKWFTKRELKKMKLVSSAKWLIQKSGFIK